MGCLPMLGAADQEAGFQGLAELIEGAHTIACCAHTHPDGDALGSQLALGAMIAERWPDREVVFLLADDAPVPKTLTFLPGAEKLIQPRDYEGTPDLFIAVDTPVPVRLNRSEPILRRSAKVAVMDHHPTDMPFGDVAVVRPDAAATGIIVTEFGLFLGLPLQKDWANDLFCALVTDTGRFQYQNANPEAFQIASLLVDAGADPAWISLQVYQSFRLAYLHLQATVMGRIVTLAKNRIAYSYATRADLARTGARDDECDGLIDAVRSVEGVEVALFLKESEPGVVRGNLRAKGQLDVSGVAQAMGGGGHRAAAGFNASGSIDEVFARVFPMLQELVEGTFGQDSGAAR